MHLAFNHCIQLAISKINIPNNVDQKVFDINYRLLIENTAIILVNV